MNTWTWASGCCSGDRETCHGTTTVSLEGGRLRYTGFCADPGYGGDYGIGSQTLDELRANGPLRPVPPEALDYFG
jgi:hypothetical protein